jgi:hypothetical protein
MLQGLVWWLSLHWASLPETHPAGYSSATAIRCLERLGAKGRRAYVQFQVLDIGFILALTATMLTAQRHGLRQVRTGQFRWAQILPLAYAVDDIAEDLALLALIAAFPRRVDALLRTASRLTIAKFILLSGSLAVTTVLAMRPPEGK